MSGNRREDFVKMEHIVFIAAIVLLVLFIFVQGILEERRKLAFFKKNLKNMVGSMPDKEYKAERFLRIPGFYEKHPKGFQIDDITWNDLGMDTIFTRVNYTLSSTGEEYLYYMLRTPQFEEKSLKHFDDMVEYFMEHDEERVAYQCLMQRLGTTGKFSLYDYLDYLERLETRTNTKDYLLIGAFIAGILLCCVELTLGIVALLVWMGYQMFSYFKVKKDNEPYLTSLAYVIRLIDIAQKAEKILPEVCAEERKSLQEAYKNLNRSKKGAFWVFGGANKTGNFLDGILDYFRMLFHFDLIYFNRMRGEMMQHMDKISVLVEKLGLLEAAISVGLYRASLQEGFCKPVFASEALVVKNGYHPMIEEPVKNSISAKGSVLLTGSNASGKSTFLKMMALNTLLAQTIYTVAASEYKAPFYRLYSSMSLKDDLESGESYYIVEIKAIKRILDNAKSRKGKILCFVDEVLRGTNTVERIAASTQILNSMAGENIQCFAATHDIELTQLLADVYENYHFEEDIKNGDVLFNYQLRPGKATTRNAIKLLEIMGYEDKIIEKAKAQADVFLSQGVWKRP